MIPYEPKGIGQGLAQVVNPMAGTNAYIQQIAMRQEKDKQEQLLAGKMLEDYNANKGKVRPQDMAEYNAKYRELQDLYIQNKGLYTNPIKHPEQYKKAQELKGWLQGYAADSRQVTELTGMHADMIKNGKALDLEDDAVNRLHSINQMPLSKIKAEYGGQLPSEDIFKFKPKPIDMQKIAGSIHANAPFTTVERIEPSAMVGKKNQAIDKVYPIEGIAGMMDNLETQYPGLEKSYNAAFNKATPAQIQQMQDGLKAQYGDKAFEIKDYKTFALADVALMAGVQRGETKPVDDLEWKAQQEAVKNKREFGEQKTLIDYRTKKTGELIDQRAAVAAAKATTVKKDLTAQSAAVEKAINDPKVTGKDILPIANAMATRLGSNLDGKSAIVISPKGTFKDYWTAIQKFDKAAYGNAYTSGYDEATAKQAYNSGKKLIILPIATTDEKTGKKNPRTHIVIAPGTPNLPERIENLMTELKVAKKSGFDTQGRIGDQYYPEQ